MDGLGELPGVGEIGGLGLHPQDVGERSGRQLFGDRVRNTAAQLVIPLGCLRQLTVPFDVHTEFTGLLARGVQRRPLGELLPFVDTHRVRFAVALGEFEPRRHRFGVRLEPGVLLPRGHELRLDVVVERVVTRVAVGPPLLHRLGDHLGDPVPLQPGPCRLVLSFGQPVQQVPVEGGDPAS